MYFVRCFYFNAFILMTEGYEVQVSSFITPHMFQLWKHSKYLSKKVEVARLPYAFDHFVNSITATCLQKVSLFHRTSWSSLWRINDQNSSTHEGDEVVSYIFLFFMGSWTWNVWFD